MLRINHAVLILILMLVGSCTRAEETYTGLLFGVGARVFVHRDGSPDVRILDDFDAPPREQPSALLLSALRKSSGTGTSEQDLAEPICIEFDGVLMLAGPPGGRKEIRMKIDKVRKAVLYRDAPDDPICAQKDVREVRGVYLQAFETQTLLELGDIPTGVERTEQNSRGNPSWLLPNSQFRERVLQATHGTARAWVENPLCVEVTALMGTDGQYGHMGRYDTEIRVLRLRSMRAAPAMADSRLPALLECDKPNPPTSQNQQ